MSVTGTKDKALAIDYDGVVADTNALKSAWISDNLGIDVNPSKCNRTECVPLIGLANYERMAKTVYGRRMTLSARPVPGMLSSVARLKDRFVLYVVTARPSKRCDFARQWLKEHQLLGTFREILSAANSTKAKVLSEFDVHALLEDDIRHLQPTGLHSFRKYLLAPTLRTSLKQVGDVTCVRTWRAFVRAVT